ncbi:hypothetical protein FISHEDRAFT_43573 [Fistulina hepatica ATCC 64428]|uniref:Uncharacterized protein n=1 Tax=Fistulina hepatica ATCC 64428 TaxID=1128425 RepID=A0A0D7AEK9_9AGAR|nr:hypothetical protein FISHEDRAFT_43573 [Fistulina hepatica ATCC 64428]
MVLFLFGALCSSVLSAAVASQAPFNVESDLFHLALNSTAPFVFNELYSLLTQWPNVLHPNGHVVIPGELAAYTLMYHSRKDTDVPPPSPEWFAFDPEMSYAIMATKLPGPTYWTTWRTLRPAKIVYLDGMAAAWGEGWLDSQHALIAGTSKQNATSQISIFDDYARAGKLCELFTPMDVDGIIRMNGGFRPADGPGGHRGKPSGPGGKPEEPGGPEGRPGRGPGRDHMVNSGPLARSGNLEWLRASARRPFSLQPHLKLSYKDMVTFHHPRLSSLVEAQRGRPMSEHFIWAHISDADILSVLEEVKSVLTRDSEHAGTNMDWQTTARDVVDYWADRIVQLHERLTSYNETGNATQLVVDVQQLSYTLLNPYLDYGASLDASGWELVASAIPRCASEATGLFNEPAFSALMTPQERLLKTSIDTVLQRLCGDFGALFAESTELRGTPASLELAQSWTAKVASLMEWLDWGAWLRCSEVCSRDVS